MKSSKHRFIIIFVTILLVASFFNSCSKKDQELEKELTGQLSTILNDENIDYLMNTIDMMEALTLFMQLEAPAEGFIALPEQFEKHNSRQNQLVKLGMLWADISYIKILGGESQLAEYDVVFQRYIKDLNLSSVFKDSFGDYMNIYSADDMDEKKIEELKVKFRNDLVAFIDRARHTDEEFLLYFTFGVEIEFMHLTSSISKYFSSLAKYSAPQDRGKINVHKLHSHFKNNTVSATKFFNNIWNQQSDSESLKEYKEFTAKLKPLLDEYTKRFEERKPPSSESIRQSRQIIEELRQEILK